MMNETCVSCEENISAKALVYCYKCGKPHHRDCFGDAAKCGTGKCKSTIYISNTGNEPVDCKASDNSKFTSGYKDSMISGHKDSMTSETTASNPEKNSSQSPVKTESADNPWLMVFCMLLAFVVILGVTVLLARTRG